MVEEVKKSMVEDNALKAAQFKARIKLIAKQRKYYKVLKFFNMIPLMHNCQVAIKLLGAPVSISTQLYTACPICKKIFAVDTGKKQVQQGSQQPNAMVPIRKKAAKRS